MNCPIIIAAAIIAARNVRSAIDCRGESCAWFRNGECAVATIARTMSGIDGQLVTLEGEDAEGEGE